MSSFTDGLRIGIHIGSMERFDRDTDAEQLNRGLLAARAEAILLYQTQGHCGVDTTLQSGAELGYLMAVSRRVMAEGMDRC